MKVEINNKIVMSNMIKAFVFSYCHNCPAKKSCGIFKQKFAKHQRIFNESIVSEKEKIIKNPILNEYERYTKIENIEHRWSHILEKSLLNDLTLCEFERAIAKTTFNQLNTAYNVSSNLNIIPIIEQIIKLKIKDFKLNMAQREFGMIIKNNNSLRLVPGMHYSIETARGIADLVKIINDIVLGNNENKIEISFVTRDDRYGKFIDVKEVSDGTEEMKK